MYLDSATTYKGRGDWRCKLPVCNKGWIRLLHQSPSTHPSIYHPSLSRSYVAKEYLGLEVEERPVYFDEVKDFAECGLCGTAAVISPVGKIVDHGKEICLPSGMD